MFGARAFALALLLSGASAAYTTLVRKPNHNKYVACYFQSWAIYRNGDGGITIGDIKAEYCTHLIYAFAGLEPETYMIRSLDNFADLDNQNGKGGYKNITQLRYRYPGLKVSLALGGWNEGSYNYSMMARKQDRRRKFTKSVVDFLRTYNFDGLDLDWEFPTARGGREDDKHNFVLLLQDLKEAFRPHNFLLTAAISADTESMETRYDLRSMSKYLDHIHVMTYDYHVLEGQVVMPNAPLDEVNKTLNYLLRSGVPASKFILGLPTYGRGYVLAEPLRSQDENPIGKRSEKHSWAGPYSNQEGFLGYNEVCTYFLDRDPWIGKWDNLSSTPYAVFQRKVIVYDNPKSLQAKVHLAMKKGLGGVMVWSIDTDDFNGKCVSERKYERGEYRDHTFPLMKAITYALERDATGDAGIASPLNCLMLIIFTSLTALTL